MSMFDLSIVIPVHNAIRSDPHDLCPFQFRFQERHKDMRTQVIIVDDASTDSSAEFIRDLATDFGPTTVVKLPLNVGPGAARNAGLDVAAGDFVSFADADDTVNLDVLLDSVILARDKSVDIVSLGYEEVRGPLQRRRVTAQPGSSILSLLTRRAAVWRFLFRREFLLRDNLRFPDLYYAEDILFMLRVAATWPHLEAHDECAYAHQRHDFGLSGSRPDTSRAALALQELALFESASDSPELVALSRAWGARVAFRARVGLARTHPIILTRAALAALGSPRALRRTLESRLTSRVHRAGWLHRP
jgi:hypothetical protein